MSAFSASDLPDGINTVEKVHLWSGILLQHLNPDLTVIETGGQLDRAVLCAPWFISAANPPNWRIITRSSIQVNSNWQRGGKLWSYALELGSGSIPSEFKSN